MATRTNKERIEDLEKRVDALTAALWEVIRLSVVDTEEAGPTLTGLAGVQLKLEDGGLAAPEDKA